MKRGLTALIGLIILIVLIQLACGYENQASNTPAPQPQEPAAHEFTLVSCEVTTYTDRSCNCGDTEGVIVISGDELTVEFIGRTEMTFLRTDEGSYANSRYWGEANLSDSTITMQEGGFLFVTEVYDTTDNSHICTFEKRGVYKSE